MLRLGLGTDAAIPTLVSAVTLVLTHASAIGRVIWLVTVAVTLRILDAFPLVRVLVHTSYIAAIYTFVILQCMHPHMHVAHGV